MTQVLLNRFFHELNWHIYWHIFLSIPWLRGNTIFRMCWHFWSPQNCTYTFTIKQCCKIKSNTTAPVIHIHKYMFYRWFTTDQPFIIQNILVHYYQSYFVRSTQLLLSLRWWNHMLKLFKVAQGLQSLYFRLWDDVLFPKCLIFLGFLNLPKASKLSLG